MFLLKVLSAAAVWARRWNAEVVDAGNIGFGRAHRIHFQVSNLRVLFQTSHRDETGQCWL